LQDVLSASHTRNNPGWQTTAAAIWQGEIDQIAILD
jgi:hypothetical protein